MTEDIRCEWCGDLIDTESESTVNLLSVRHLADGTYHESCAEELSEKIEEGIWIDRQIDSLREER